jgi:glutamine synthetase
MLAVIVVERAVSYGVAKAKAQEVINKVAEMEKTVETFVGKFYTHANDSSMHLTPSLMDLLKERNDYVKTELANTRTDVQRIEQMLSKM